MQGGMSINDYCTKLKRLADQLRDIGHAVSEPSMVLNLLRGLSPRFRYVKPVITSKYPPHTFQSARSFILLEELSLQHNANAEAGQALTVTHGDRSAGSSNSSGNGGGNGSNDGSSGPSAPRSNRNNNSGGGRYNNRNDRRRQKGNGGGGGGGNARSNNSNAQSAPYAAGFHPWQGMVQAWQMPFLAPGAGVLGPRPPFQPQQAMMASHLQPPFPHGSANSFDTGGLYATLQSAGVPHQPQSTSDWYFDTGATSHMSSNTGNLSSHTLRPSSSSITVGNGARLPVTHQAHTVIPTASSPLHLNNVLVSPSLIKNLISVRQLTRDNNVSIEFDLSGFSIKDLPSREEMLRCESSGDLYPLRIPRHQALTASSTASLWHQRLGHPRHPVNSQVLQTFSFSCNKIDGHSCSSCCLGKHTRLPFRDSASQTFFPFQIVHSDVWTSPVYSHSGYKYYVVFLMITPTISGLFPYAISLTFFRQYARSLPMFRLSFAFPFSLFRQTMAVSMIPMPCTFFCPLLASSSDSRIPTHRSKMARRNASCAPLMTCVRTLLIHSAAPLAFWAKALATATYLINRRPCRATASATPHSLLFGVPPSYDELRVFGCRCYPNMLATSAHKLAPRSATCVFIGYPADHRGYRCYDITTGRIITSRHVVFDEAVFPFRNNDISDPAPCPPPVQLEDDTPPRFITELPPHPTHA